VRRSTPVRRTPLARGGPLKRTTPLRQRSTSRSARKRKAEQEGPQWALCHATECVACFHARWVRIHGQRVRVDWTKLGPGEGCHGHHEPPRSLGGRDRQCLSLCPHDHERRHRYGKVAFWLSIDYPGALAEMTRRAYPNTKPVVDTTASEKT
jgi:hypothetical protein